MRRKKYVDKYQVASWAKMAATPIVFICLNIIWLPPIISVSRALYNS